MSSEDVLELDIGFSPCPNDTFIFDALIHRRIDTAPFRFRSQIADVEELNERAFAGTYPLTKLSFYAYLLLKDRYCLLDSGAALGYGCGPLLIARKGGGHDPISPETGIASPAWIRDARIAVPGRYTTAYLLLQLWQCGRGNAEFVRFDEILPGVASGRYDAGLVIHEGRFVYQDYDCRKLVDLGQWWEAETGLPLPLGCIALRRDISRHKEAVEALLRQSVDHARRNPRAGIEFIKLHAQELDERVISAHISLYVNEFTLSLGETGMRAVETLEERVRCLGIL
ncbi:MAG: 1,4-dihydroxy-6-naphthoate synthase [Deltaproteobacteria bacterium]|nr:1,4-dihydroxy-6-naphthoate synthase [Deltaproteobacteria bacterium]